MGGTGKGEQMNAMKNVILDSLIDEELLWQEAKNKKLVADEKKVSEEINSMRSRFPSKEAFLKVLSDNGLTEESYKTFLTRHLSIKKMVDNEIAKNITASDKEANDFYTGNPDKFKVPEQVHARHILVKVDPKADQATKDAAKKKIDGILKEAKGGADFAELAKKYSDCPSKEKGGDLGTFSRGQMVKPFEDVAFALKPGTLSDVVETQFGYHIIKVEEHKAASIALEKDVTEKIKEYLKSQKINQAVMDHVKGLRDKAKIEILMKP
jgi:peptidyl-prolyl cis-trans isomerase C